jgi:hypothetical protein
MSNTSYDGTPLGTTGVGVVGLDPSAEELAQITDIVQAYKWAGIGDECRSALEAAIGGPIALVREVLLISLSDWMAAVASASPLNKGRLASLRRVGRLRMGLVPGEQTPQQVQLTQAFPPPVGGTSAAAATAPATNTRKLRDLVDQTLDISLVLLDRGVVVQLFEKYSVRFGGAPMDAAEPTHEQISAVSQILEMPPAPYVDLGLFGPFGKRLLARLVFAALVLGTDGAWSRKEISGPGDFQTWWTAWKVLSTTFVLLDQIDREKLDAYAEHIRSLSIRYAKGGTDTWAIVYSADVRMRRERFERIRRLLELGSTATPPSSAGYDIARPWNSVFAAAINDRDFWDDEVKSPCLLYLTQVQSAAEVMDDGTTQPDLATTSPAPRPKRQKTGGGAPQTSQPSPKNRASRTICTDYTGGNCSLGRSCEYAHQCNICLDTHPGCEHAERVARRPQNQQSGKGGKPGKGGKSGKGRGKGKDWSKGGNNDWRY